MPIKITVTLSEKDCLKHDLEITFSSSMACFVWKIDILFWKGPN